MLWHRAGVAEKDIGARRSDDSDLGRSRGHVASRSFFRHRLRHGSLAIMAMALSTIVPHEVRGQSAANPAKASVAAPVKRGSAASASVSTLPLTAPGPAKTGQKVNGQGPNNTASLKPTPSPGPSTAGCLSTPQQAKPAATSQWETSWSWCFPLGLLIAIPITAGLSSMIPNQRCFAEVIAAIALAIVAWVAIYFAASVLGARKSATAGEIAGMGVALGLVILAGPRLTYLAYAFLARNILERECPWNALPCQQKVVDQATHLIREHWRPAREPLLITLDGGWGAGKSLATELIEYELRRDAAQTESHSGSVNMSSTPDAPNRPVVVKFNAVRHQNSLCLEFDLYREIIDDPEVLYAGGWLVRPFYSLLVWSLIRYVKVGVNLWGISADLHSERLSPGLLWTQHLAALAEQLRSSHRCLVVILDEVDRCDVLNAQMLYTFLRRLLYYRNIAVIMPYVDTQIKYKVLNPAVASLSEISSMLQAVLWERVWALPDEASDKTRRLLAGLKETQAGGSGAEASQKLDVARILCEWHFGQDKEERERNESLFAEKVFSCFPIHMPPLGLDDMLQILSQFPSVRSCLRWYNDDWANGPSEEILAFASEQWKVSAERRDRDVRMCSIRQLEGAFVESLSDFHFRASQIWSTQVVPAADGDEANQEQQSITPDVIAKMAIAQAIRRVLPPNRYQ
jgi:hypothetical protein